MSEFDSIKKLILQKLIRSNMLGGKHTPLGFITKGIPGHYRNTHKGMKFIEKVIKELRNDAWIIIVAKRTGRGYDEHISLNPKKVKEIQEYLEKRNTQTL